MNCTFFQKSRRWTRFYCLLLSHTPNPNQRHREWSGMSYLSGYQAWFWRRWSSHGHRLNHLRLVGAFVVIVGLHRSFFLAVFSFPPSGHKKENVKENGSISLLFPFPFRFRFHFSVRRHGLSVEYLSRENWQIAEKLEYPEEQIRPTRLTVKGTLFVASLYLHWSASRLAWSDSSFVIWGCTFLVD